MDLSKKFRRTVLNNHFSDRIVNVRDLFWLVQFDFNFGQMIKASEFTNERVFGINIISNLCPYDQCIFQCNHSFDIDEIEVWSFSITNICQDSLPGFRGHLQSNNCKMVQNRFLIWVSRSDIPNHMCDCFWKCIIPIIE